MRSELFDRWVAVQVRSRSEQMVEVLLRHKGYEVLAPCLPKPVVGNRRGRPEPLFPGYVFCKLGEPSQGLVVATPGVLRFAGPGGRPEPVPPDEIAAIQTLLASGLPISPAAMQPGCAVELVTGPLLGCRGTLVECKTRGRVLIGVSLLQRAISVVVEREWLQPLPAKPKPPVAAEFRRPNLRPAWRSPALSVGQEEDGNNPQAARSSLI